jgi:hypothetical protein
MANETKREIAVRRVQKGLAALATYARIREELILKRVTTPLGVSRTRLEESLLLNQALADETKIGLRRAEDELLRELENPA